MRNERAEFGGAMALYTQYGILEGKKNWFHITRSLELRTHSVPCQGYGVATGQQQQWRIGLLYGFFGVYGKYSHIWQL